MLGLRCVAAAQIFEHFCDRDDLRGFFRQIIVPRVAPPVPAALRVEGGRCDLGKQHDQLIAVGPAGKARRLDEGVADRLLVLGTAMERDMNAATAAAAALRRAWPSTNASMSSVT